MIGRDNLREVLGVIGFTPISNSTLEKRYHDFDYVIQVDFKEKEIRYQEGKDGIKVHDRTTCNFERPENFVVLECVNRILEKGYRPEHIELERRWSLGHEAKGGKADICVLDQNGKDMLFIIECKTYGTEYKKEYNNTLNNGGQLFSYWQQERATEWLALYASDFDPEKQMITYLTDTVNCSDDKNILELAKKDSSVLIYKNAHTAKELFEVWKETYEKRFAGDVIFRDDSTAYTIGVKPLRKKDLRDFSENDKVVNRFEEILRHNNVSDKENAFNRLVALFICKLVDEIQKTDMDEVEFQYKAGTDTYESLQDRLQRLHKEGMEKFMKEDIFYVSDNYAENLVQQYTGQHRKKMIADLKQTIRILKFYTNNDFAFKDVHNEELFLQNGKILVEVVQLFENYRIIGSNDVQALGDLFEQLLNKGFKQNEGQFFTPVPITRFIWDSLPLQEVMKKEDDEAGFEYPRIIDYACGAGHFLTEGFEAVVAHTPNPKFRDLTENDWTKDKLYGVEKDYRLARVSKIALFMHGTGDGNIIFGDGLENYPEKGIESNGFDILVANPPYSVAAFKAHLKLKNNDFEILPYITNTGSEIETLFVERIGQLVKPQGIAAVILPSSILNKENNSFIKARESLLTNFMLRAIVHFGSKTFGATGTNTVVLFLEKYDEPPKRIDLVADSIQAILEKRALNDWEDYEILQAYLEKIGVSELDYRTFLDKYELFDKWVGHPYFGMYVDAFCNSSVYKSKKKQASFKKKNINEQMAELNYLFYDYVINTEQDKLTFFGLVYNYNTLIVTAPDKNKEQEIFLGYKWSNRKGQEGIQITSPGGKLYNAKDRDDKNTLAGITRSSFAEIQRDVPELKEYYHYLRTQDMLDFSSPVFNKAIKTTKIRIIRKDSGMEPYRLSNKSIFELMIGDRVLTEEITDKGKYPVYSANMYEPFGYIDKLNLKDFSLPSVIWGIDGDWMVNCIPANEPFYPTDHCGVLRIKSESIMPEYMTIALEVAGKHERFSRSNRASIQRIKSLIIPVPEKSVQESIIKEVKTIDTKIRHEETTISNLTKDVKSKFIEMFGTPYVPKMDFKTSKLGECCLINPEKDEDISDDLLVSFVQMPSVGEDGSIDASINVPYSTIKQGYTYFREDDVLFAKITPCMENGKGGIAHNLKNKIGLGSTEFHVLRPKHGVSTSSWLYYLTRFSEFREDAAKAMTGASGHRRVPEEFMANFIVGLPAIELQNEFTNYVCTIDKLKFEARERKQALEKERETIIEKHFA